MKCDTKSDNFFIIPCMQWPMRTEQEPYVLPPGADPMRECKSWDNHTFCTIKLLSICVTLALN